MKDTLNQIAYDSTTRFATGTATNIVTGNRHEVIVILVTLLAPVLREMVIRLFDYSIKKFTVKTV